MKFTESSLQLKSKKTDTTLNSLIDEEGSFILAGYPDDEGIEKNGGQVGAKKAPSAIRNILYRMTPPNNVDTSRIKIKDRGDLDFSNSTLEARHDFVSEQLCSSLKLDKKWIGLGGGHDYGYADGLGFLKSCQGSSKKPVVVNFDAHFDLRNLEKGVTSGTPFFRLLETEYDFEFFEVGIQKHCNDRSLYEYAEKKKVHTLDLDDLYSYKGFNSSYFTHELNSHTEDKAPCYISVDIDGFSSQFAPGCSQSWSTGFDLKSFEMMFDFLLNKFDVKVLGLYEVSPPLDLNHMTSRLASLIIYRYLFHHA